MSLYSSRPSYLRPGWVLIGLFATLALLVAFSHRLAYTGFHKDFVRFPPIASPESYYTPALEEYLGIVRSHCAPDQVLVLVGGNSILYGVGQPPDKLWSKRLQELLGPDYCVLNFAFRGGSIGDGASIVGEVLRKEYPRQILIANAAPLMSGDPIGGEPFRYLIKAAWDRGLLETLPARDVRFKEMWPEHQWSMERTYNLVDGWLRFRTLGNFVTWHVASFLPNNLARFPASLKPRGRFPDQEPDVDLTPWEQRYIPDALNVEMSITRGFSTLLMEKDAAGNWVPTAAQLEQFKYFTDMLRPMDLRKNSLILVSSNSPYYLEKLSPDELARDRAAMEASVVAWQDLGYSSLAYGEGFTAGDFVDRTHLTGSGGAKLATLVAEKIKEMTKNYTYE